MSEEISLYGSHEVKNDHKESVEGVVTARKCDCCGHHEIGLTTQTGEYISLKPGMKIKLELSNKNISKEQALEIFGAHVSMDRPRIYNITDSVPDIPVYGGLPAEECWYISCSSALHGSFSIGPGRTIAISKKTGRVLIDGSFGE